MTKEREPLVDEREAAGYAGISLNTMKRHRYNGEGPDYVVVGRHIRYRLSAIDKWLDENTIKH